MVVSMCSTVPDNERVFLMFPFFVFKEQQSGGISKRVSSQEQVAKDGESWKAGLS